MREHVCAECEGVFPESMVTTKSFVFPAADEAQIYGITVDYTICTRCFVSGGLSDRQKERIRQRVVEQAKEKKKPLEGD